jgi:hypothetical protein
LIGTGSNALRTGTIQYLDGPLSSQVPIGLACISGACWFVAPIHGSARIRAATPAP